ncbi:MAG: BolA family protein [Pseudomonadota bacterium]
MDIEAIEALLRASLAGCEVQVSGEGNHLGVVAVGELFAGLRPVQRQQRVYAVLKDLIAAGEVHAVQIRTYTPEEWRAR